MNIDKKNELITQILYRKYSNIFKWLLYNDLSRLIKAMNIRFKISMEHSNVDLLSVKATHKRVFPILERIDQVKCLRSVSIENIEKKEENLLEKIDKNNIQTEEYLKNQFIQKEEMFYKNHNVFVDSYDRNKSKWSNINPFQFAMGPGSIDLLYGEETTVTRSFSNVESISITRIVLPSQDLEGNIISEKYPYILLSISEINNKTNGTNKYLNNSFGQLTNPTIQGSFSHYVFDDSDSGSLIQKFEPRIEISRLTFHFTSPDGSTINFNSDDDADENGNSSNRIGIEIHVKCLQKKWSSNYINRPTS